jgi:molybdopterin-containing oxidoreductase family iron-sulfur binding subunit
MDSTPRTPNVTRRQFASCAAAAAAGWLLTGCGPRRLNEVSPARLKELLSGMERQYSAKYGKAVTVSGAQAIPGVEFAYALDLSRCIGCRRCVYGCVEENNQSRDPEVQWIKVFSMEKSKGVDFTEADPYYQPAEVPEEGHFYVPTACQQCRNPPCTKVCPTGATWADPDGIVVIDYDWCIGCRYCMAACPYGARHFNWGEPTLSKDPLSGQPPAAQGRGREVHVLHPADASRSVSRLCRGLPGRRAEVREPARSRQRDPLHHRAQAGARAEAGSQYHAEVLLLLRHMRPS